MENFIRNTKNLVCNVVFAGNTVLMGVVTLLAIIGFIVGYHYSIVAIQDFITSLVSVKSQWVFIGIGVSLVVVISLGVRAREEIETIKFRRRAKKSMALYKQNIAN
jgi:hypothetical protein